MKDPIYIVGGGVIGLLQAWYFHELDIQTVVIDRQSVGSESSWAGGGVLSPLHPSLYPQVVTELCMWSQRGYSSLAEQLRQLTGTDSEWIESGLLVLDRERKITDIGPNTHVSSDVINAEELGALEPRLKPQTSGAQWFPHVAQIRTPRFVKALQAALKQRGVQFEQNREVEGFDVGAGRLRGIRLKEATIETDRCVVSAGAWSSEVLRGTGITLPIRPIRGQMLLVRAPPGLISHIIVQNYRYLIPRRDGRILVGSTLEDVGFNKDITATAREELVNFAVHLVPELAGYPIEHHWAGLRPGSPDDIPFIGPHPQVEGLFVCTGHHRNGFAMGPASARLAVDLVLGRPPLFDPWPYRLTRETSWTES